MIADGPDAGAFVQRENGVVYRARRYGRTQLEIEERGTEKVVVRGRGWYSASPEDTFCQFDTRVLLHRGSAIVRLFHTWTFTGDGNSERIRDLGLRLVTPGFTPRGFLSGWDDDAEWVPGDYLLQFDHDRAEVKGANVRHVGRATGVLGAVRQDAQLYVGVRDFWQNFPNELEFEKDGIIFHQWPKHERPRTHGPKLEDAFRLWHVHEGSLLDFRTPMEFCEGPICEQALVRERHWQRGKPESVNAQGVAKTDEIWLCFTPAKALPSEAKALFAGLNQEAIRPIVDPQWVCATGAFGEVHARDTGRYPSEEHYYELHSLAPMRWAERCRVYGKWIWGDMLGFPRLHSRSARLYRCFRKAHQGWPYPWLPFARSGDVRSLCFAQAAVRHMTDVCFCHYSDARVPRAEGWWNRCLIPWAGFDGPTSRGYVDECDYLWQCYYLTGYPRAAETALEWAHATKRNRDPFVSPARRTVTLLRSYIETYRATFDPWFLAAAHRVAQIHVDHYAQGKFNGHFWNPGDREFHRFTGSDEFAKHYLYYARQWAGQRNRFTSRWWATYSPMIEASAHAYLITGDEYFLRRSAGGVDYAGAATYDGEVDHYRGVAIRGPAGNDGQHWTPYYLRMMPHALYAFEKAGRKPIPLPQAFFQNAAQVTQVDGDKPYRHRLPTVALRKTADEPLVIRLPMWQRYDKKATEEMHYRVVGPGRTVAAKGQWDLREETDVTIPAEAPAGTYRLLIEGKSVYSLDAYHRRPPALYIPVSPMSTPEVLEYGDDEPVGQARWRSQYWFRVPEGVGSFWVDFRLPVGLETVPRKWELVRLTVWHPDGEPAWRRQFPVAGYDGPSKLRVMIDVPNRAQGRLWRITIPGLSRGFALDPKIPHIFATSPDRFFMPQDR